MLSTLKNNKVKVSILVTLTFVLVSLTYCATALSAMGKDQILMRIAHSNPRTEVKQISLELFKTVVEVNSKGRIKVEIYPAAQLGGDNEQIKGVMTGTLEAALPGVGGYLAQFVSEVNVFSIPYLFKSEAVFSKVVDGQWGKELADLILQETGMRVLAYGGCGYLAIGNNVRPIHKIEDMEGLKIRTMPSPAEMEFISVLGASPTPMAWAEVYGALQHQVVDGVMTVLGLWEGVSFYEVLKYGTDTHNVYSFDGFFVNEKWFQGLPPDLRKVITDASLIWRDYHRGLFLPRQYEAMRRLQERGVEMSSLTAEEYDRFKKATQQTVTEWVTKDPLHGDSTWVDKLLKACAEAEDEISTRWLAD